MAKKCARGALSAARSPISTDSSFMYEANKNEIHNVQFSELGSTSSPLKFVNLIVMNSVQKALIDTGSAVSIVKPIDNVKLEPAPRALCTASGDTLNTYGVAELDFELCGKSFTWKFFVCDTIYPILGADFLVANSLSVELTTGKLFSRSATNNITWLDDYEGICDFDANSPCKLPPEATHEIITSGPPLSCKPRRLTSERHELVEKHFNELVKLGVARPSNSPWASPLHLVGKKDGTIRPVGDYRRLNKVTQFDTYPIPHIVDLLNRLYGANKFTSLDLQKGYYQIPVKEEDIQKTAVSTPCGTFEFRRMPFGLKNAGQSCQRLMNSLFRNCKYVYTYIDDILIATPPNVDHEKMVRVVLSIIHEAGLKLKREKCHINQDEVIFLGHVLSQDGVRPTGEHVQALRDFAKPVTVKDVRRFLGMINFYRRFVPEIAEVLAPLHAATAAKAASLDKVVWDDKLSASFNKAKELLADTAMLHYPAPDVPFEIVSDASGFAIGGALSQVIDGVRKPLAFFSRMLEEKEKILGAYERELIGAHAATMKFKPLIEGRHTRLLTDHKPVVHAFGMVEPKTNSQKRMLSELSELIDEVCYIGGKDNIVADALSRARVVAAVEADAPALSPLYKLIADASINIDVDTINANTSLELQRECVGGHSLIVQDKHDVQRTYVPETCRAKVLELLHEVGHPGQKATQQLLAERFVWPAMKTQVKDFVRSCHKCQMYKVHRRAKPEIMKFGETKPLEHLHVDLVGPLSTSNGFGYLFTMIDRATRWFEVVPLKYGETDADNCINAMSTWTSRYGFPAAITADRGPQFRSAAWKRWLAENGITDKSVTAYHPEANGIVERFHRTLKEAIATTAAGPDDWANVLDKVCLKLRTMTREDGYSASTALMGRQLRLSIDRPDIQLQRQRVISSSDRPTQWNMVKIQKGGRVRHF